MLIGGYTLSSDPVTMNPRSRNAAATEPIGATIDLPAAARLDDLLFNEAQGRIVLSTRASNASTILMLLELRGIPARRLGTVGGNELRIKSGATELAWPVAELHTAWADAIPRAMEG